MEPLTNHLEFVKSQAAFHAAMIDKHKDNEKRQKRHIETKEQFEKLAAYIEELQATAAGKASPLRPKGLALSWDEVEDLPEELLQELSVSDADKAEFQILSIMEEQGGVVSLDRLIVELYKQTGEVTKRSAATNRLYRMVTKGLIHSVSGKRGVYSLRELTEEEAESLI